ncbi:hypothetical protein TVAG_365730 [Trichomonas vaginalis G3]|uniref:Rab-GAP TBC domain-containing protein n=1 Tax=Trichomonas vaginalis (strain ATCC PRA-98 / G3) TaxID=412133 RepID=A2DHL7_TRIV3|nr:regulation of vesicle fusion [Trichomonas vaginalis G3]EAY20065.1 hypothetical protein TVAG_365730 [Trichomonas vaginalis G3]KAI5528017.1 regulation of vesicle fusion [Trichomonas vaginalis G3]|eukprot:XP_001581051.1 hypothetical protein [Trichomonas vaginalis G3]
MLAKSLLIDESSGIINDGVVRDFAAQGIRTTDPRIRYYLWQFLLHLLPNDRSKWESTIKTRFEQYFKWVKIYFPDTFDWLEKDFSSEKTVKDFGLKNDSIMTQIYGDVIRMPNKAFIDCGIAKNEEEVSMYAKRIQRILYLFSNLNSAYSYTQGFNEIVLPLYEIVLKANRVLGGDDDLSESITFFLFQNLVTGTGLGDLFTMEQDFESVNGRFKVINKMIYFYDKDLYTLFNNLEIDPLQFAFPWVTLLFTQIYTGESLFHIWDKFLLKKVNVLEYAMAMASAHLIEVKSCLIGHNFNEILEFLQNIPPLDVTTIAVLAEDVWTQYCNGIKSK